MISAFPLLSSPLSLFFPYVTFPSSFYILDASILISFALQHLCGIGEMRLGGQQHICAILGNWVFLLRL